MLLHPKTAISSVCVEYSYDILTFDLWLPKSNWFILRSKWMFVPCLKMYLKVLRILYGNYSMRSHENYKYFSVSWESASTLNGAKPPEKCPHYTDWHSFQLDTLSQVWNHETHRTTYKCMHRYTHWDILYKFTVRCQQTCIYTQIFIECSGTLRQTVGILPHTVKHWYWQLKHAPEYFIFSCSLVSQSHY